MIKGISFLGDVFNKRVISNGVKSAEHQATTVVEKIATKATEATPEALARLQRAQELGLTPEKYSSLKQLAETTNARTVTPEEVIKNAALRRSGSNVEALYSRTFKNSEGALEKTLSNGDRVVIKDLGNGQTSRQVYRGGKLMVDDVKTVSTDLSYPGKTVRTKHFDRISSNTFYDRYNNLRQSFDAYKFDYTSQRVYDKNGRFLGMKETEVEPIWGRGLNSKSELADEINLSNFVGIRTPAKLTTWETKTIPNKNLRVFDYMKQEHTSAYTPTGTRKAFEINENGKKRVVKKDEHLCNPMQFKSNLTLGAGSYKPVYNAQVTAIRDSGGYFNGTGSYIDNHWWNTRYNAKGLPIPEGIASFDHDLGMNTSLVFKSHIRKFPQEWQNILVNKSEHGATLPIDNMSLQEMRQLKQILGK